MPILLLLTFFIGSNRTCEASFSSAKPSLKSIDRWYLISLLLFELVIKFSCFQAGLVMNMIEEP